MWNWYEWNSLEDFEQWHNNIKQNLGYPLGSYNQATGQIDLNSLVYDYTQPFEVNGKYIARVREEHSNNLVLTELRLPEKEIL